MSAWSISDRAARTAVRARVLARRSAGVARDRRGVAAVEFALGMTMLLLLLLCVVELGRYLAQGEALEKGLRAGAMYAARQDLPLTGSKTTAIQNLVRTGTKDGSATVLAPGFNEAGWSITPSVVSETAGGVSYSVVRIDATIPYDELFPGLLGFFGLGSLTITRYHEQAYVGT